MTSCRPSRSSSALPETKFGCWSEVSRYSASHHHLREVSPRSRRCCQSLKQAAYDCVYKQRLIPFIQLILSFSSSALLKQSQQPSLQHRRFHYYYSFNRFYYNFLNTPSLHIHFHLSTCATHTLFSPLPLRLWLSPLQCLPMTVHGLLVNTRAVTLARTTASGLLASMRALAPALTMVNTTLARTARRPSATMTVAGMRVNMRESQVPSMMMESGIPANTPAVRRSATTTDPGTRGSMRVARLATMTANGTLESTLAERPSATTMVAGIPASMRESQVPSMMMESGIPESILVARRSVRMMEAGTRANTRAVTLAVTMASGKRANMKVPALVSTMANTTLTRPSAMTMAAGTRENTRAARLVTMMESGTLESTPARSKSVIKHLDGFWSLGLSYRVRHLHISGIIHSFFFF